MSQKTPQQSNDVDASASTDCSQFVTGQQAALSYVLDWITSHTCGAIPRPAAYDAAMIDISINVKAAMSRLESGGPMESMSTVD